MDVLARAIAEGRAPDPDALIAAIPYCRYLGVRAEVADGRLILVMPFAPHLVGNPMLPALHGGVIGSLLETAAIAQVIWETRAGRLPKPVDITVDYLRTGRPLESRARARIARQGRRIVNVHAEMWQEDEAKPIAALRGHFLLDTAQLAR
jgi:uncharacterized protein (TIGR00369 family)